MRAMVQTDFGGPEAVSLRDVPEPVCGPRDVLVEVVYCGLNRLDLLQRKGPGLVPGFRLPHVPGMDFAGTVVATGSAVGSVVPGDRVVADPTQGAAVAPGARWAIVRTARAPGSSAATPQAPWPTTYWPPRNR